MKKALYALLAFVIFIIGFVVISVIVYTPTELKDMDESMQKSTLRTNMREYCSDRLDEPCMFNHFTAVAREYANYMPEDGDFSFVSIRLDSVGVDAKTQTVIYRNALIEPTAETSLLISNTRKMYYKHDLGIISFVGIKFKITTKGEILSHSYFASFHNEETQHEEFVYFNDETELDISKLVIPTSEME